MLDFKSVLLCLLFDLYLYLYFYLCFVLNAVLASGHLAVLKSNLVQILKCNASCSAPLCCTTRSPVFCILYFILVFCNFGADPQCNTSFSAPLCFTRRSRGENAELHPAREITASALDHSMMSRCQAYCWKGDICTVIFERYYGKYSPSAIISQSVKQKYKKCTEIYWQLSSLHMICFRSHNLCESVVTVKLKIFFFRVPANIYRFPSSGENVNE